MAKRADVEVSDQTQIKLWIQAAEQAWDARAPNLFDTAVQTNKTSPIKHENKRNVLSCLIECLMALKFFQTRSNSTKQGGQTVKCWVTKQCLMVFGCQTFPVWTGLNSERGKDGSCFYQVAIKTFYTY